MNENDSKNISGENHLTVLLPKDHPVVRALEKANKMSVTDDIAEEIVTILTEQSWKKFSRETIYDYIREETTMTSLVDEIEGKLKKKGITVGP